MSQASYVSIKKSKVKLKKSLGQNFLKEQFIVEEIIEVANIDKETTVIEIGPGIGALTQGLIVEAGQIIAIEIDKRLINILTEKFQEDNFELLNMDFLDIDQKKFKDKIKYKKVKVVANLPYYITTPIIMKILIDMLYIDEIYIMVQKEVAQRICAKNKTKQYGSLSVFCQTISTPKLEFVVKKECFEPEPKIDSAIISFKRKENDVNINEFSKFLQNCFVQKRKTLVNCLNQSYKIEKKILIEFLEKQGLKETTRAEEIENIKYIDLFNQFNELIDSNNEKRE